jgi:hypothetical protein
LIHQASIFLEEYSKGRGNIRKALPPAEEEIVDIVGATDQTLCKIKPSEINETE